MKKWEVKPTISVGGVRFHESRSAVRNRLELSYKEIKKSNFSKNTMDVYESFHVFYNENDKMEAIEFFAGNILILNGKTLFPGKLSNAQKLISDFTDDGDGCISRRMSIGITLSADDPTSIESILVGCNGYYSDLD